MLNIISINNCFDIIGGFALGYPQINSFFAHKIILLSTSLQLFLFALLAVFIVATPLFLYLLKKQNNTIEKLGHKLESTKKENQSTQSKLKEFEQKYNNSEVTIQDQNRQIDELSKSLHNIHGKVDEEVLKRTSELHTLLEKSVESNRLKEAFLEKISREIRTPLNSILGFVNLLNDSNLAKIDREYYLKFIRESGNNLLSLIDNIVDFTRLETGDQVVEYKRCNLDILAADLMDKYRTRLIREKTGITMIYTKPENYEESLADCRRILHILDQLINNAIKFTEAGKIELTFSVENDQHVFTVSDTGIGIDPNHQDIIFERFYQIEPESREYFQGAGLGLTIAKGLTDLLGGRIEVESEPGKGSNFKLYIPFKKYKVKSDRQKDLSSTVNWKGKTILIAEDEASSYHFLKAILYKTKATILWAPDGVKFLEIMDQNKDIDLVLLDIKMPGINGFNAIKVIRQQNISIPVIAQTAFNQPEDKQRCLDCGCDDYLAKPIDQNLLLSKISKYFNK